MSCERQNKPEQTELLDPDAFVWIRLAKCPTSEASLHLTLLPFHLKLPACFPVRLHPLLEPGDLKKINVTIA